MVPCAPAAVSEWVPSSAGGAVGGSGPPPSPDSVGWCWTLRRSANRRLGCPRPPPGSRGRCPSRGTTVTRGLPSHISRVGRSGSSFVRATQAVGSGPVPVSAAPVGVFSVCAGIVRSGVEGGRCGGGSRPVPEWSGARWSWCLSSVGCRGGRSLVWCSGPRVGFLGLLCVFGFVAPGVVLLGLAACWLRTGCGSEGGIGSGSRGLGSAAVGLTSWPELVGASSAVGPLWSRLRCGCGGCLVAEAQLPVLVAGP